MFTKSAAFFCVLAASSVFAVPIPKRQIGSPAVCNVGTVQTAIADMRATADSILKVGIPLPDEYVFHSFRFVPSKLTWFRSKLAPKSG
ncbi:hypothetical protein C8J57DRAFT_1315248 [Mycena rebaudengoi]|nr:hypothetical protein C8J57DRAFT_1315248 [Mycena rebaudengoi]